MKTLTYATTTLTITAIDLWIEEMVKPVCKGKVALMRYADDAVICCQYESDAQRIQASSFFKNQKERNH